MRTIIEDDVLFHNKTNDDFEFIVDDEAVAEVREDDKIIGKLYPDRDWETVRHLL